MQISNLRALATQRSRAGQLSTQPRSVDLVRPRLGETEPNSPS